MLIYQSITASAQGYYSYFPDPKEQYNLEYANFFDDMLSAMSDSGWELVTIFAEHTGGSSYTKRVAVFRVVV